MKATVKDIAAKMEEIAPEYLAEPWDNVGLLAGCLEDTVRGILTALDLTEQIILEAISLKCNMIITHHPFIFKPVDKIRTDTPLGKKIQMVMAHGIHVFAAHTNLDKADGGVNDMLCEKLGLQSVNKILASDGQNGFLRIGRLNNPLTLNQLAQYTLDRLQAPYIPAIGDADKQVKTVAVSSGSGMSMFNAAKALGADVFMTGDIKYHDAQDIFESGFCALDISHFASEVFIAHTLSDKLNEWKKAENMELDIYHAKNEKGPLYLAAR